MQFKEIRRINQQGLQNVTYKSDGPLNPDRIIQILKNNQKGKYILYYCKTSSYTSSGNTQNNEFRTIQEITQVKAFTNPNIHFHAIYIDRNTNQYAFSISTDTGANIVDYTIDDKMVDVVAKKMERDKMIEEALKKEQESKDSAKITNK